jgi:hypothetical protein
MLTQEPRHAERDSEFNGLIADDLRSRKADFL